MQPNVISRRSLLTGAGSFALAAPLLQQRAYAQSTFGAGGLAPPSNGAFLVPIIQQLGLDQKLGMAFDIKLYGDQALLYSDFATGRSTNIYSVMFAGANLYAQGVPIPALFTISTANGAFVSRDPKITKISDLKGKTIAAPTSSGFWGMTLVYLAKNGLDPRKNINVISAPASGVITQLMAERVDAGLVFDPAISNMTLKGYHLVGDMVSGVRSALSMPPSAPLWFVGCTAHKEWIDADPSRALKVLRMWQEAADFYNDHGKEADKIISEFVKMPIEALQRSRELKITNFKVVPAINEKQNMNILFKAFADGGFMKPLPDDGFYYQWPKGT